MILVCPACDAKFKIPDGAIPPGGRKVRCAQCKHSWHADPSQVLTAPPVAAPRAPAAPIYNNQPDDMDAGLAARAAAVRRSVAGPTPPPAPMAPIAAHAAVPAAEDDFDDGPVVGLGVGSARRDDESLLGGDDFGIGEAIRNQFAAHTDVVDDLDDRLEDDPDDDDDLEDTDDDDGERYEDDDFLARRRAEQRRAAERNATARDRKIMLVGWASLIIFIVATLYVLIFESVMVKEKWPASHTLYGWFEGMSDIERLQPEEGVTLSPPITEAEVYVRALLDPPEVDVRDGVQVLVLKGFVENTGTTAASVPQLELRILDNAGRVLDSWVFNPPGRILTRGRRLNFEESHAPIPIGAASAEVKVLENTKSTGQAEYN